MQRALVVLCSTCPISPICQDISNPEQDEPFWQNENPSCRTRSHDIVACLLSSQPGMVALEVVSTPFHIREANALMSPGENVGRFPPVCCALLCRVCRLWGHTWGRSCCSAMAAEQCVASGTHVFQLEKQIMNPSTCHPSPECSILQPRSNSDGGLQKRSSKHECGCRHLVISDSGAHA